MVYLNPTIILLLSILPIMIIFFLLLLRDYFIKKSLRNNKEEFLNILLGGILDLKIVNGRIPDSNLESMLKSLEKLPKHRLVKNTIKNIRKYPKKDIDPLKLKFKYTLPIILRYLAIMAIIEPSLGSIIRKHLSSFRHDLDLNSFISNVIGEFMIYFSSFDNNFR